MYLYVLTSTFFLGYLYFSSHGKRGKESDSTEIEKKSTHALVLKNVLLSALDQILYFKLWVMKKYNEYFPVEDFVLESVKLYLNLRLSVDTTYAFSKYCKGKIDLELFDRLLYDYNTSCYLKMRDYENMRLKITYKYKGKEGVLYYTYLPIIERQEERYVPYPPYTEKIMEDFKKDIVLPYYPYHSSKPILYPFYMMDCKDVKSVLLYKEDVSRKWLKTIQKIQSPLCDFGLLYDCPIRLKWICVENNFDIYNLLSIRYLGYYLNEDTMTLEDLEMVVQDLFLMKEMVSLVQKKSSILNKYMKILK